jgi:hypothetical protein
MVVFVFEKGACLRMYILREFFLLVRKLVNAVQVHMYLS